MARTPKQQPEYWPEACAHLSQQDAVLAELITTYPDSILTGRGDAFFTLARAIVGQQISVKAADSIWARFEAQLGSVHPHTILDSHHDDLRAVGLSGQKVTYLNEIATHAANGRLNVEDWHSWDDEAVIKELVKIKGIGRWTAEMFLIFNMLRPDVFPLSDLGLKLAMHKHYNGGEKPESDAFYSDISQNWGPYRTVATWYLWRSLDPVEVVY